MPVTDQSPVWMPDGRRLVFKTEAGGVLGALCHAGRRRQRHRRTPDGGRTRSSARRSLLADGSGILFSDGAGPKLLRLNRDRSVLPLTRFVAGRR